MADRTCPKCNLKFKFPSILKTHVKNSFHCLMSNEDIEEYINKNSITKKQKSSIIKCVNCNLVFSQLSSLTRHNKETKCGKLNKNQNTETDKYRNIKLDKEFIKHIKTLPKQIANTIEKILEKKEKNICINNTTNTTNNNIDNITNNNTDTITNNIDTNIINHINNNINIQHINPFGFEDVRTIPMSEMKLILNSGENAGIYIIKSIYNKLENKNFYKPNISKSEIAFLNEDFKLTVFKTREFADALFDRCIVLLHHILYLCKTEYTSNMIRNIYDNIEHIENTMRTEIYDKNLQTIIESEIRNNNLENKTKINKYIKDIKDISEIHNYAKENIKKIKELETDSKNNYKISLGDQEFNKIIGDPKLTIGLTQNEIQLDMILNRFEDTKFYKFWIDRIKLEQNLIDNYTNTNTTNTNTTNTNTTNTDTTNTNTTNTDTTNTDTNTTNTDTTNTDTDTNNKKILLGDIINIKKRIDNIKQMLNIIKLRHEKLPPGEYINLNVGNRYTIY